MSALPDTLSVRHALPAIAVMEVWGTNCVVIRVGLDHLPPLLFATCGSLSRYFQQCFF